LEAARTGLAISQKGLDVTGHNIANVDTNGYTRQRIITTAVDPYGAIAQFKPVDFSAVGSGVTVKILDQIRSVFFDRQYRTEQSLASNWNTRTQGLTYVESLFEDQEDSALSNGMLYLFEGFMSLSTEANDKEQRTVIQQAGISLTDSFNQIYDRLVEHQENQNLSVEAVVGQINTLANNIAELNRSIYSYELNGQRANDLRDRRNLLLDELSCLVKIDYQEGEDNKLVLKVAGTELINHVTTTELQLRSDTDPITGLEVFRPTWDNTDPGSDLSAEALGGELKAHIQLRDNSGRDTSGIPFFIDQLNTLARGLVRMVNDIHSSGYSHPASGASTTGINFFNEPSDITDVTAGNIRLDQRILDDVYNIAASDRQVVLGPPTEDPLDPESSNQLQEGNQHNARKMYDLINQTDLILDPGGLNITIGGFNSFMTGIIMDVAITLQHSKTNSENQRIDLLAVDNQRTSISGVSLDEEMTNLIKYQHSYNGASRVITTMDEILDVLINRMGLVGRS
jgi:flagellar hook-associated protein 1 FlgK